MEHPVSRVEHTSTILVLSVLERIDSCKPHNCTVLAIITYPYE